MSRSLVFGTIGAVVGGLITRTPQGAQYGFLIGSTIGAATTPGPHSEGPRINDLSVSTSTYGSAIPHLTGTNRVAGTVVWASAKRESSHTEGGKGGGPTQTSYTYDMDLLILLSENQIGAITRVWSDGKLVWKTGDPHGPVNTNVAAIYATQRWCDRITVYRGALDQLPDPTYETAVGTANAPAYRGRGSVFLQGLKLPNGNVPNLTFEVVSEVVTVDPESSRIVVGESRDCCALDPSTGHVWTTTYSSGALQIYDPESQTLVATIATGSDIQKIVYCEETRTMWCWGSYSIRVVATVSQSIVKTLPNYKLLAYNPIRRMMCVHDGSMRELSVLTYAFFGSPVSPSTNYYSNAVFCKNAFLPQGDGMKRVGLLVLIGGGYWRIFTAETFSPLATLPEVAPVSSDYISAVTYDPVRKKVYAIGGSTVSILDCQSLTLSTLTLPAQTGFIGSRALHYHTPSDRVIVGWSLSTYFSVHVPLTFALIKSSPITGGSSNGAQLWQIVDSKYHPNRAFSSGSDGGLHQLFVTTRDDPVEQSLADVVSDLCLRAGMTADQFDVSGITGITKPVRGMAISTVSNTRTVLETLMNTYFFSAVLSDKMYFIARGGSVATTLPYAALGVGQDGSHDPLPLTRRSELELPAQLALTYVDANNDYQPDTQYSDRLLTGQTSVTAVQVPLVFNAPEAKAITDVLLTDAISSALKTTITVSLAYTRLEPTDVIVATDAAGSTFRFRITQRTESAGALTFALELDDPNALVAAGVTSASAGGQTVVVVIQNTTLDIIDIPLLRDVDNHAGIYIAVRAEGDGEGWGHCELFQSLDDLTYSPVTTISTQAVIGITLTVLGNWTGGNVFDETNTVTVSVPNQELSSATTDDILTSVTRNAAVIGGEIVQFKRADLIAAGTYVLSGLLRGRRGTEYNQSGHMQHDRFVMLSNAGMRYLSLDNADLASVRYGKAASAGQFLEDAEPIAFTPTGEPLRPFSPVDARADRTTTDTVVTWKRRTRLSTRLVGSLAISAPLGEATENYEVEVWNSSFTTLKRTITVTSTTATYTGAQQVTDFGSNQSTLYLRIYQLSAVVGRGHMLQITV